MTLIEITVWRNRKAQEHYNPQANLSNIEDPQVLYDLLQNSADPEGLQVVQYKNKRQHC